jgi:hypothetical protein
MWGGAQDPAGLQCRETDAISSVLKCPASGCFIGSGERGALYRYGVARITRGAISVMMSGWAAGAIWSEVLMYIIFLSSQESADKNQRQLFGWERAQTDVDLKTCFIHARKKAKRHDMNIIFY